jgi:hypothetical protein
MTAEVGVGDYGWRGFTRRHWGAVAIFVVACVVVFAAAVYVFWWFTGNAQSTGVVPSSLGIWTMGNLVNFILYTIFWEILFIGIPVIIGAVVAWQWLRRLPEEERRAYRHFGRGSGRTRGSGGLSLLFFILFAIKIYLDGNWNVPIATFSVNYVVGSMIAILAFVAAIVGIPLAIGMTWWVRQEIKKA